ncbi:Proteasome subunit beta type-4 [Dimargaris cristalligena]|uniref:Proteasome subunit beta n=1 Tax=Dimargaris cristalligena TaxID=215637 RepID=A0A4P9ZKB4_9FUNG|nr:Proteasome subunit beta type-4 [Dimargaris cristalligena]RKP33706.1 nucleophile aminohydrolase [Dimargaris cristalligena]|eukprot:RKP33706.1 nucleophile aminohydrolase [Dimargaris cristalligena]
MECLMGLVGKDFVITVTDTMAIRSITVLKHDEDKTRELNPHTLISYCGEAGDTTNFAEYVQKNVKLYGIRNNIELTPGATANFVRRELADSLRTRSAYQVNLLVSGYDHKKGPCLYWIDHLSALAQVPFAAHGYCAYYCISLMDRHYHPDISLDEAMGLIRQCLEELHRRFIINMPRFVAKVVDKDGIRVIDL